MRQHRHPRRAAQAATLAAAAATLAYAAHSTVGLGGHALNGVFEDGVYNAVIATGALLALMRAACDREQRAVWGLLGAGLGCWSAGDIVATAGGTAGAFPSASDFLWIAFYPAAFATLVLLVRARMREFYASLWLDGLIGALTLAALTAQFVFPPIVTSTGGSAASVVGDLVYPICDGLLLVFVAGVLALTHWRPGRTLALVSAGVALGAAADCWSLYWSSTGHSGPSALDALWPASALVLGSAAWAAARGRRARVHLEGLRLLAMPVAFALPALLLLALGGVQHVNPAAYGFAVAALTGVVARLGATFAESLKLSARSRHDALTDPLTRLANRRRMMSDLEDVVLDATDEQPYRIAIFDLNGFKAYNDAFGHPAGDRLLARLASRLDDAVHGHGRAYRLGGDEFCVLLFPHAPMTDVAVAAARAALSDRGDGMEVTAAYGVAWLPREARDVATALEIADERLYAQKRRRAPVRDDFPVTLDLREEDLRCA